MFASAQAFLWALLSGVSEPIGAAIGYAFVVAAGGSISDVAYAILFGLVAGMMVSICIKELIPTALRYDPSGKIVVPSFVVGMVIMAFSLVLFAIAAGDEPEEE
jgi:zinc transporter, ZIP family